MDAVDRELEAADVEFADDSRWEPLVGGNRPSQNLASVVTLRLEPATAEQLRSVAEDQGVGYTTLLRNWVKERLDHENREIVMRAPAAIATNEDSTVVAATMVGRSKRRAAIRSAQSTRIQIQVGRMTSFKITSTVE